MRYRNHHHTRRLRFASVAADVSAKCVAHEELLERCSLYAEIAEHGLADQVFLQRDLEEREEVARL